MFFFQLIFFFLYKDNNRIVPKYIPFNHFWINLLILWVIQQLQQQCVGRTTLRCTNWDTSNWSKKAVRCRAFPTFINLYRLLFSNLVLLFQYVTLILCREHTTTCCLVSIYFTATRKTHSTPIVKLLNHQILVYHSLKRYLIFNS